MALVCGGQYSNELRTFGFWFMDPILRSFRTQLSRGLRYITSSATDLSVPRVLLLHGVSPTEGTALTVGTPQAGRQFSIPLL